MELFGHLTSEAFLCGFWECSPAKLYALQDILTMGFTFGSNLRVVGTKLHCPFGCVIDDVKRSGDAAKFLKRSVVDPFTHRLVEYWYAPKSKHFWLLKILLKEMKYDTSFLGPDQPIYLSIYLTWKIKQVSYVTKSSSELSGRIWGRSGFPRGTSHGSLSGRSMVSAIFLLSLSGTIFEQSEKLIILPVKYQVWLSRVGRTAEERAALREDHACTSLQSDNVRKGASAVMGAANQYRP